MRRVNFVHVCVSRMGPVSRAVQGPALVFYATVKAYFHSINNNNNDRLTAFDPGQPG